MSRTCSIPGCGREHYARGLCKRHYCRLWHAGQLPAPVLNVRICSVPGCGRKHYGRGVCSMHYLRLWKHGSAELPVRAKKSPPPTATVRYELYRRALDPAWGCVTEHGYKMVTFGRGRRKLAHRAVMEWHLGRALGESEVVHHVNGDKLDNRIENLELLAGQSSHMRKHAKHVSTDTHRECARCHRVLSRDGFYRRRTGDKSFCWCKECTRTYRRAWSKKNSAAYRRRRLAKGPKCNAAGCSRTAMTRGLCEMHYQRLQRIESAANKLHDDTQS